MRNTIIVGALLNIAALIGVNTVSAADTMPIAAAEIDTIAERALQEFPTPGMSVGILKDGELVFAKGYGLADIENKVPVTPDTVFGIGSQTKAYTAAALAILMDDGKLTWDDRVIDHIPEFRMYDPYVTREFTIRDLLTHRSGLDLGVGDLLVFPNANSTVDDILAALRHFEPVSSFRSKYDYDNLLYIVAGEVVSRVSGMNWATFVEKRIMEPLGMETCRATRERLPADMPHALPYMVVEGDFTPAYLQNSDPMAPAGAIHCSLTDHAKWIAAQLNGGKAADGAQVFSPERHAEMWQPNTLNQPSSLTKARYNQHFQAYALGWSVSDMKGQLNVRHGGGLLGMVTYTSMLPEQDMAVLVMSNSMNFGAMMSVMYEVLDAYLGVDNGDWVETFAGFVEAREAHAKKVMDTAAVDVQEGSTPPLPEEAYTGTYRDAWYGDIAVNKTADGLEIAFGRTAMLTGELRHFRNNTFVAYWHNRTLEADAYVTFSTDVEGRIEGIRMKPVSPLTDFSFDFKHLNPVRVRD